MIATGWRVRSVCTGEGATADERHLEHVEKAGSDINNIGADGLAGLRTIVEDALRR